MRIGYLLMGGSSHGPRRHAEKLADEGSRRADIEVIRVPLELTGNLPADRTRLIEAATRLGVADVAHVQHAARTWGTGSDHAEALRVFGASCSAPLVVTVHDVVVGDPWRGHGAVRRLRAPVSRLAWHLRVGRSRAAAYAVLGEHCRQIIVCFEHEADRLRRLGLNATVIPMHVDEPSDLPDRESARRDLALESRTVLTLLGFIHRRKGHDLMVDALRHLPADVTVVFAGQPTGGGGPFLDALLQRARRIGVADRLLVTGHLTEENLKRHLAAADLAVCPFRYFSASATMADWISVGRPLLCSRLPQVAEYDHLVPGAIRTFHPYSARALASRIRELIDAGIPDRDPEIDRLARHLRLQVVWDRHLDVYRRAVAG